MSRLNNTQYMRFPFTIGESGAALSSRLDHVREQIEQVLFTLYGERWYRPEFGVGVMALVFEPNNPGLWEVTKKRLLASLADALKGEVDPKTLSVNVTGEGAELSIIISYTLATINHTERQKFLIGSPHG
ncbi:GPW/gp25 family protein [Haloferula chungangensis]|uniref:GPW/gp25 family protein n=1 Tax=Haloferula chungangensis TaxID=1048331 RepID=A0ABW2L0J7_9BACT